MELKKYVQMKSRCEEEMMSLKNAHYEACKKMGWTDEEIEKDWERVVHELGDIIDERRVKDNAREDLNVFNRKPVKA